MIGKITTIDTLAPQPVDSQVETRLSTEYLINTDYITQMYVSGTTDSAIGYKFDVYSDRIGEFWIIVNEANTAIQSLADATPASPKLSLNVFEDSHGNPVQSFNQVTGLTPVAWTFNVYDIVWAEDDETGNYCRIWIVKGGHTVAPYIVDNNIDEVIDRADTGTTTTTSTSTTTAEDPQ